MWDAHRASRRHLCALGRAEKRQVTQSAPVRHRHALAAPPPPPPAHRPPAHRLLPEDDHPLGSTIRRAWGRAGVARAGSCPRGPHPLPRPRGRPRGGRKPLLTEGPPRLAPHRPPSPPLPPHTHNSHTPRLAHCGAACGHVRSQWLRRRKKRWAHQSLATYQSASGGPIAVALWRGCTLARTCALSRLPAHARAVPP